MTEAVSSPSPSGLVTCKTEAPSSPDIIRNVVEILETDVKTEQTEPSSFVFSSNVSTPDSSPIKSSPTKKQTKCPYSDILSTRLRTIVKNLQYLWPPVDDDIEENKRDEFKFLKKSLLKPASKMLKG